MQKKKMWKLVGKIALVIFCGIVLLLALLYGTVWAVLGGDEDGGFYLLSFLIAAVLLELTLVCALWGQLKKKACWIPVCAAFCILLLACGGKYGYRWYIDSIPTVGESENPILSYAPYGENTKVASLDEESTLTLTEDLPVLDGATALYPVYSAFAKAVYPKEVFLGNLSDNPLKCSTTTGAYKSIVTGDADMIFAAPPSDEQAQYAADNGATLVYTPIGKEAFVFFVNAKNPLEDITLQQIQDIYAGEITDWSALGVSGLGEIRAFQRDEGSGSQSSLVKIMGDKPLMTPPTEDVVDGMAGVIHRAADYKNYKNAIGYSFRFYATEMVTSDQIKLLRVNGVYPSLENIENGNYPLASSFYAVTRSDADENTLRLLDWVQGKQGQELVKKTGYTPYKE